jgi:hypothetical protein
MKLIPLILILLCGCATPPTNTTRVMPSLQSRSQSEGVIVPSFATITPVCMEAQVQWLPLELADTDLTLDHYNVYYGLAPREYIDSFSTDSTNAFAEGLSGWTDYYFAVTAVYSDGEESDYSDEAHFRPALLLDLTFPELCAGIESSRDLVTWTARDALLTNGVWRVTASNALPQEFFRATN